MAQLKPKISVRELANVPDSSIPMGSMRYRKIEPKRSSVIRKGDKVKKCFYFNGMKQCLGVRCYWPRVGTCQIWDKINKKNGNGKNGKTFKKKTYKKKKTRKR